MSLSFLLLFCFLALIAEILGTLGGFGSSLFFIPIASLFLDMHSVLGVTALFHVLSNLSKLALFKEGVDWKIIIWMGVPATLLVFIGAWLSKYISTQTLAFYYSFFLMAISLFLFIVRKKVIQASSGALLIGGTLSGFMAGLLGSGGAIRGVFLAGLKLSPAIFIATSAAIDFSVDATRSIVYGLNGFVHVHDLYLIPILGGVSFLGTFLGKRILAKMKPGQFDLIVLVLIFLTGIVTFIEAY